MIAFNEIDNRLESLGKDRPWLAETTGRSPDSIRTALAPNAPASKRSNLLQKALSDAIEREEEAQGTATPQIAGIYEIRQTPEQTERADRASRMVSADSFAEFCLAAIQHRANEILNHGIDPCAILPPFAVVLPPVSGNSSRSIPA